MRPARVAVAKIDSPSPGSPLSGLEHALIAGLPVVRYGRTWRVELGGEAKAIVTAAQAGEDTGGPEHLHGRLGYDKLVGSAPAWDEAAGGFVSLEQHDGDVVPFAIRLADLTVAFQRTSKIRRMSFIAALQNILREGSQNDEWVVDDQRAKISWQAFRAEVRAVREVTIYAVPTNPGWAGQEYLQPFIEEVNANKAKIVMRGDDLNLDSMPIEHGRTHAERYEDAELYVRGVNSEGVEVRYDSDADVPLLDVNAERIEDGSVPPGALEHAIEEYDDIRDDLRE